MTKILDHARLLLAATLAFVALGAQAQLSIEITGSGASRFPVIIPVFENESSLSRGVSDVVRADLERSGLFNLVDIGPVADPESRVRDLAA
ncbi:MAG: translocation protein TolB, partial [Betaproteobacteria bacterium HGW-Betaproteobacteria-21]